MADVASLGCKRAGCGGPQSGVCINNLPFEECPDVLESEADGNLAPQKAVEPQQLNVSLPGGRSLDTQACDDLLRQRGGTVIGLVAPPDFGKTTLIATMYELLHRRRMATLGFAGSETLRGFEERSHLTRLTSNAARPDTKRTAVSVPLSFTHLRVAMADAIHDIVFSDRSGEHFDKVLARPTDLATFPELHRANAIILLVDLVQLIGDPHLTTSAIRRLFLALDQCGLLEGRRLLLVGTKADLALPSARSKKAKTALTSLTDELSRRAGNRFLVTEYVIACRARAGSSHIGEGIERLLTDLLEADILTPLPQEEYWPPHRSELDQLMRGYWSARA
jgi:hypothetical protein